METARPRAVGRQREGAPAPASSSAKTIYLYQRRLLPADLAAFVLFLKPTHQRFEVLHHRASGNVFAGRFLQDFAPIFAGAFFQDVIKHRRCRRLKLLRFREKESRRRPTDLAG